MTADASPLRTPLYDLHLERGAKMVEFAGYSMPVSFPPGIIAEHKHARSAAALFDVSHMGQLRLVGAEADRALETLMPVDIVGLERGRQRYGFLTNRSGGILDDLMVTRRPAGGNEGAEDELAVVVNAACKNEDLLHLQTSIGHRCSVLSSPDQALLALQGPLAAQVLARLDASVAQLTFLGGRWCELAGAHCFVTRSGYTGEDGFEISVPAAQAVALARTLLDESEVKPAGLGARDTLRLEAGLCLYGHDIDAETSPVEAGLAWAIGKVRRSGGAREGHYPGAGVIDKQLASGAMRRRVGLLGLERVPVREGATLFDAHGHKLGHVTSGTLSPTLNQPIAMAYLAADHAGASHEVHAEVRGRMQPMRVVRLPFVPHRYHRG